MDKQTFWLVSIMAEHVAYLIIFYADNAEHIASLIILYIMYFA